MKAADADRKSRGEKRTGQIDCAWKLVGLNADKTNQRFAAGSANELYDLARPDAPVSLVVCREAYVNVRPEHRSRARIFSQTIQAGERVGRNCRPHPLDRITVIIIMSGLDHHEIEHVLINT